MERIQNWCEENSQVKENLFVKRLRKANFNDEQIDEILTTIDCTCNECWDSDSSCQCWNEE